ncbi:hypothetical protein TL16_g12176 [Triparma laevis f. inornata]|uniref:UBA domain-containing protein n=1 Tax=Triparma laevis f. inornata TaxID=1714386 RepID=A0A9W7BSK3_9STRA|nr:hypothetical protein TL16_g12176 [Triparma laevis f. inornata]
MCNFSPDSTTFEHACSNPHQFIDDDSMDGESANQYNRINNHRKLISKLILSLFKHTMHWAAGEVIQQPPTSSALTSSPHATATPKQFLEATLSTIINNPTPEGSACLIEFTSLCLLHSVEFMTTLINSSRKQKSIALLNTEDLNKIEHGVFGTILPSIILGMLPFAIRPTFARRLLPLTIKFVQCLDELLELCPYLVEQSSEGKKSDGKNASQLNSSSPLPNKSSSSYMGAFDLEMGEDGALGMSSSNSSNVPVMPHMTPFPWMSSLLNSSSLLAGNLAKTLIDKKTTDSGIGSGSGGRSNKSGSENSELSGLCARGIDARYASILSSHGLTLPSQSRLPPPAPPTPPLDSLCDALRKNASSKDMSYAVVCKQFLASTDCPKVLQFEKTFFTAALKHDNLTDFVRMYAASDNARKIPCSLALAWRAVSEATKWLWSRRSQIKANNSEKPYQLNDLFLSVSSTLSLITVLSSSQVKSPLPISGWLKPSTSSPRMRWRRTINMVICALRWRKIGKLAEVHRTSSVSTHFTLSGEGAKQIFAHVTKYEKADSAQPVVLKSSETLSQLLESYNRSTTCVVGLNGFFNLFKTVKSKTTRSVLLREFTRAVRPNSLAFPTSCVVFRDLVAPDLRAAVHKSFEEVYFLFLEELKSFMPKAQPAAASHTIFNQANLHYYLLLLDAWGISFNSCRSFLSSCDIFETLSSLLRFFDGYSSDSGDGNGDGGGGGGGGKNAVAQPTSLPPSSAARSTHRLHGSSSITKERLAQVTRCRQATWAALRLLVSQAFTFEGDGAAAPLSVLYHNITSAITTMTTSPPAPSDPVDAKTSSSRDSRKRCQELIGAPKQFCGAEDGMKFGPELLLHNSKGSDFSIAFWLYLTQDSTGKHRSLVVRGHKQERWPIILLRPQDRRLDIGYAPSSPIFSSSSAVPLNKWVHVALVSESNKLKLYFNGATDMHRQNPTHMNSPRTNKHSLYVGKVPDNAVKLDGVRSGFEGSVAFLRFYSRALSPIHVRIVYDQGPPSLVEARDRRCYQIAASLTLLKSGVVKSLEWRNVLLKMFTSGTARVAQGVVRLWMKNLPGEDVGVFGGVMLNEGGEVISVPSGSEGGIDFVSYLLRVVGLSLWKAGWSGMEGKKEEEDNFEFKNFLPSCITASGDKGKKGEGKGASSSSSSTSVSLDSTLLTNEVTSLLQAMLSMDKWATRTTDILRSALGKLQDSLPNPDHFDIAESFAAMKVLSQPDESLRPGVTCTMTHSDVPACVIAYDAASNLCHCVVKNPPTYFGGVGPDTRSIVKINGDDVVLDSSLKLSGWACLSESRVVGEVIVPLAISLLKMREEAEKRRLEEEEEVKEAKTETAENEEVKTETEADAEAEADAEVEQKQEEKAEEKEEELPVDDDDARSFSEDVPEDPSSAMKILGNEEAKEVAPLSSPKSMSKADRVKEVFENQALSRVLTLVHSITLTPLLSELLNKELLSALTAHAVKSDGSSSCVHLHAVEKAVCAMRLQPIFETSPLLQTSPSAKGEGGAKVTGQQESQHIPLTALVCNSCGTEYASHVDDGRCDSCKQSMNMEGGAQEDLISQLIEMGFREEWCALALRENNNDVEFASTWIVDNLDFLGSLGGVVVENDESDDFEENEEGNNGVQHEDDRLPLIDNLESEGCRNIYEENYFPPADPNLHYNSERTNMVVNPEMGSELLLSILRARAAVVQLLPHFSGESEFDVLGVFGGADPLIHFIKLSCFRGRQFDLFRWKKGENAEKDEQLVAQTLIKPFLESLTRCNNNSEEERELGRVGDSKEEQEQEQEEEEEEEDQSFINLLLTVCLDDFEAAASINAFDEMAWGSRMLTASDSQALLQPNVELSGYILDLLISNDSHCMFKSFTFQRISGGLMSANMPTKEVCMKLMWRIVVGWRLRLESGWGGKGNLKPEIPEKDEIVGLVFDHVPLGRLKR